MTTDLIFWLDLETTGLDPLSELILEVGLVVTRGLEEEIDSLSVPILYGGHGTIVADLTPDVFTMHAESGLLDDIVNEGLSPVDARLAVRDFLDKHQPEGAITVGGSGIDRFDLPFLRESAWFYDLPDNRFHFRTLDMSGTKNLLTRHNITIPPVATQHRAVDDARWAFHVGQHALDLWRRGALAIFSAEVGT